MYIALERQLLSDRSAFILALTIIAKFIEEPFLINEPSRAKAQQTSRLRDRGYCIFPQNTIRSSPKFTRSAVLPSCNLVDHSTKKKKRKKLFFRDIERLLTSHEYFSTHFHMPLHEFACVVYDVNITID